MYICTNLPERKLSPVTSPALHRFIGATFPTVAHLEAALWFRARPDVDLVVEAIAAALYLDTAPTRARLLDLCRAGILVETSTDAFRWQTRDASIAASMDEVARAYDADLRGITSLIHAAGER
jgi:hypothetical protein